MSDTNPLPAAQLLALADELLDCVEGGAFDSCCLDTNYAERGSAAVASYRAARAASPVTQSVALDDMANTACRDIPEGYEVQLCMERGSAFVVLQSGRGDYLELPDSADKSPEEQINDALEVAKEHARRLAGEGGA